MIIKADERRIAEDYFVERGIYKILTTKNEEKLILIVPDKTETFLSYCFIDNVERYYDGMEFVININERYFVNCSYVVKVSKRNLNNLTSAFIGFCNEEIYKKVLSTLREVYSFGLYSDINIKIEEIKTKKEEEAAAEVLYEFEHSDVYKEARKASMKAKLFTEELFNYEEPSENNEEPSDEEIENDEESSENTEDNSYITEYVGTLGIKTLRKESNGRLRVEFTDDQKIQLVLDYEKYQDKKLTKEDLIIKYGLDMKLLQKKALYYKKTIEG